MSAKKRSPKKSTPMNIVLDPTRVQTLYSDIVAVASTNNGMTLQFGQLVAGGNEANVVSSVGISFDHAHKIIEAIQNELARNER